MRSVFNPCWPPSAWQTCWWSHQPGVLNQHPLPQQRPPLQPCSCQWWSLPHCCHRQCSDHCHHRGELHAVCSPFTYQTREVERGHWWILSSYIMPVMLTATMLNIPKLLHLSKMDFMKNIFKHNRGKYIKFDIISQLFHPLSTTCLLSIIILCFLTYRIFLGSKRIVCMSTNTDKSMAKIMMTIVAVFILFSIPKASSHCSKSQPSPSS